MELSRLLPPSHVIVGLKGTSQRDIVRTLAEPLLEDQAISNLDDFVDNVLEREKIFTTQIMPDVAFPHAHCKQVKHISLVIGLAPEGLAFSPDTEDKCHLFFLIAVPTSEPEAHLELMANLVDFVMSDKLSQVLAATEPQQILDLLAKH